MYQADFLVALVLALSFVKKIRCLSITVVFSGTSSPRTGWNFSVEALIASVLSYCRVFLAASLLSTAFHWNSASSCFNEPIIFSYSTGYTPGNLGQNFPHLWHIVNILTNLWILGACVNEKRKPFLLSYFFQKLHFFPILNLRCSLFSSLLFFLGRCFVWSWTQPIVKFFGLEFNIIAFGF